MKYTYCPVLKIHSFGEEINSYSGLQRKCEQWYFSKYLQLREDRWDKYTGENRKKDILNNTLLVPGMCCQNCHT